MYIVREDDTGTKREWGYKLTWPDGHTEIHASYSRDSAEHEVSERLDKADGVTAQLLNRTISVSGWESPS